MPKRFARVVRTTLLVVVEGDTEFAFCKYLRAVHGRGCDMRTTIQNAHGGSPDRIVDYARRLMKARPHDHLAIVFDADKPLSATGENVIRRLGARAFRPHPCIEGFFLEVLGHPKPADSSACKESFHRLGLEEKRKVSQEAYALLFPTAEIKRWRRHADFDWLVRLFGNEAFSP